MIRNPVRYNPYQFPTFMVYPRPVYSPHDRVEFFQSIERASFAHLDEHGKAWAIAPRI